MQPDTGDSLLYIARTTQENDDCGTYSVSELRGTKRSDKVMCRMFVV